MTEKYSDEPKRMASIKTLTEAAIERDNENRELADLVREVIVGLKCLRSPDGTAEECRQSPSNDPEDWCLVCRARAALGRRHECPDVIVSVKGGATSIDVDTNGVSAELRNYDLPENVDVDLSTDCEGKKYIRHAVIPEAIFTHMRSVMIGDGSFAHIPKSHLRVIRELATVLDQVIGWMEHEDKSCNFLGERGHELLATMRIALKQHNSFMDSIL